LATPFGPSLTISASAVAPSSVETVTLANGLGGSSDWLALAAAGVADSRYLQWTYVGAGVTTRTSDRHDAHDRRHLRVSSLAQLQLHPRRHQSAHHRDPVTKVMCHGFDAPESIVGPLSPKR
jgi:hypothetical protein